MDRRSVLRRLTPLLAVTLMLSSSLAAHAAASAVELAEAHLTALKAGDGAGLRRTLAATVRVLAPRSDGGMLPMPIAGPRLANNLLVAGRLVGPISRFTCRAVSNAAATCKVFYNTDEGEQVMVRRFDVLGGKIAVITTLEVLRPATPADQD